MAVAGTPPAAPPSPRARGGSPPAPPPGARDGSSPALASSRRAGIACAAWRALGTTASILVDEAAALAEARRELEVELARIDEACSRFRDDSDLMRVNRAGGRAVAVSPALIEALELALQVARDTGGAVLPTLGRHLRALGYDRDFAAGLPAPRAPRILPPAAIEAIALDRAAGTVALADGAELDLGATAKALAADRAARAAHARTGAAVLVNLGGDIAVAGAPEGGWHVRVTDDHAAPADAPGQTVAIAAGGLATSSTTVRRWGDGRHHIVDPATGRSCAIVWRTASVAAADCVAANAAATAAIVRGDEAPAWLAARALPSRLVAADGRVVAVAGWPSETP
jgi:FAD:protein FMN transferase